jgi:hypothetical protein
MEKKRNIWVLVILLGLFFNLSGDENGETWIEGFKFGITRTKFSYSQGIISGGLDLTGFQIGGFAEFNLKRNVHLQVELYVAKKGMKTKEIINDSNTSDTYITKTKVTYFEAPVLLTLKIPLKSRIHPCLLLGPYGAYRLSARSTVTMIENGQESDEIEMDLKGDFKAFDWGLVAGVALEIESESNKFILEIRYSLGLKNINDNPAINASVKNRAVVFLIGISF